MKVTTCFRVGALMAVTLCGMHASALAQLDVLGIARLGDPAPGVPGFEFQNFRGQGVSSGAGNVAFAATIRRETAPGVFEFKTGAWLWRAGTLSLVALQGDPVPGGNPGDVLGHFFPAPAQENSTVFLNVNDLGRVAWRGFVAGPGVTAGNDTALFVAGPTYPSLQMAAREGAQVPGAAPGQVFGGFAFRPLPLNDAGEILFFAAESGPEGSKQGLWSGLPNALSPVVKTGDPAPTGGTFSFSTTNQGAFNNMGVVAVQLSSTLNATRGIWTATPDGLGGYDLQQIASQGSAEFISLSDPKINDAGQVVFRENRIGVRAIWRWTPGAPPSAERIALEGDPAPGTSTSFFSFPVDPLINAMGQVIYGANLSNGLSGLWIGTPGASTLIAQRGDPAPGTSLTFQGIGPPAVNAGGTILFRGADDVANGYWSGPANSVQLVLREASPGNEIRYEDGSICAVGTNRLSSRTYSTGNEDGLPSILSDTGQIVLTAAIAAGCAQAVFIHPRPGNEAPTAVAGPDQSATRGVLVQLDGGGSFDDNTASAELLYSWTLGAPAGSASSLTGAATATPTFTPDLPGNYVATLTVTDEGGLSDQDEVLISTENMAPTADAGINLLVPVGEAAALDGSGSSDPEGDPLSFDWSLDSQPTGSLTVIVGDDQETASLTPDVAGDYQISLVVTDAFGAASNPASVIYTATEEPLPEDEILEASDLVFNLAPGQVTTRGNQVALLNHLRQAVAAIQIGDLDEAIHKLETSISRTDGCPERGSPDGNGPGRDWITDCDAQNQIYPLLVSALDSLSGS